MLKPAQYHPAIKFVAVILSFHPNRSFQRLLALYINILRYQHIFHPPSRLAQTTT